ncbi:hypothetical protein CANARDRAFT_5309 [[Candida] arabinofermentans NRRL YB-2248]|uniref:Uncharacterized protein n=1 Tax=[Candida] arabinofermentans NRRL YB-2248 TaxID=983967 RepID=A0A1E4T8D1_9ASCO|nr:hypothetical protein CANARDRAFT_5309 [[Candida] arabinofermentans NRRL YB-2248]
MLDFILFPIYGVFSILNFFLVTPIRIFTNVLIFGCIRLPISVLAYVFGVNLREIDISYLSIIDFFKIVYQYMVTALLMGLIIGVFNGLTMSIVNYLLTFKRTKFEIINFTNIGLFILEKIHLYKPNAKTPTVRNQAATKNSTPSKPKDSIPLSASMTNKLNMDRSELQKFLVTPEKNARSKSDKRFEIVSPLKIGTTTSSQANDMSDSNLRERVFSTYYEDDDGYDTLRTSEAASTTGSPIATSTNNPSRFSTLRSESLFSEYLHPTHDDSVSDTSMDIEKQNKSNISGSLNIIHEEDYSSG